MANPRARSAGLRNKVEGMLLGLSAGDALGNTSEAMNPAGRRHAFGQMDGYPSRPHPGKPPMGLPPDDTQLAFWTLEHLLACGHLEPQLLAATRRDSGAGWER